MDILLAQKPSHHIFNVGNSETISIRDWVTMCYRTVGKTASFVSVGPDIEQREYFSFYNYEYRLHVGKQEELLPVTKSLEEGLRESFDWYLANPEKVNRKPLMEYIDAHLHPQAAPFPARDDTLMNGWKY